jgi:hypothetical protein
VAPVANGAPVAAVFAIDLQLKEDRGNFFLGGNKSRYGHEKFPLKNLFP